MTCGHFCPGAPGSALGASTGVCQGRRKYCASLTAVERERSKPHSAVSPYLILLIHIMQVDGQSAEMKEAQATETGSCAV